MKIPTSLFFLLAFPVTLAPVSPALAQVAGASSQTAFQNQNDFQSPIIESLRAEDPRLEKRVAVTLTNVYIGEVLDEWTRQTGVVFTARDTTGAANQRVNVLLRDVPLGDAINALWSLLSFKQATWRVERTGGKLTSFSYEFIRPESAQQLGPTLRKMVDRTLDDDAEEGNALVKLTPDQLTEAAKNSRLARRMIDQPYVNEGLRLFYNLPKERQAAVLTGRDFEKIPFDALDERGKAFARDMMSQMTRGKKAGSAPEDLTFVAARAHDQFFPSMTIQLTNMGGWPYLGAKTAENGFFDRMQKDWALRDDNAIPEANSVAEVKQKSRDASDKDTSQLPPFGVGEPMPKGGWLALVYRRLYDTQAKSPKDETVPISLMAIAEPINRSSVDSTVLNPYGKKLPDVIKDLNGLSLMTKWRGSILLIRPKGWYSDTTADNAPFWSVVRALRVTKAGQLRSGSKMARYALGDFALVAGSEMTEAQINVLADEFPGMRSVANETKRAVFRALAQDAPTLARLAKGETVPLADVSPRVVKALGMTNAARTPGAILRVRFSSAPPAYVGALPGEQWTFEAENGGKALAKFPFSY